MLAHHNPQLCLALHGIADPDINELIDNLQSVNFKDTINSNTQSNKTFSGDSSINDLILRFQKLHISDSPSPHSSSPLDNICSTQSSFEDCLHQCEHKRLGKAICQALHQDRRRRAARASKYILTQVIARNYHEAYNALRGWYRECGGIPSKPTKGDLHRTRIDFESLYMATPSPGEPIPIHVTPFPVNDDIPSDEEIISALHQMRRRRVPGASGIRTEDLIRWQTKEPENWKKTVWLIQNAFTTGNIPEAFGVELLALIPKTVRGDKLRGIALLEVIYKLCATIIHIRLSESIKFHPGIHAFRRHCGTGTAILEAKLLMQKAIQNSTPLYQVFMDLSKAYDMLDRNRLMTILAGYGVGQNVRRLLTNYWNLEVMVPKSAGYFGDAFHPTRGIRQGGPDAPIEFDIVIDCVLREWETQLKTQNIESMVSLWYADDG